MKITKKIISRTAKYLIYLICILPIIIGCQLMNASPVQKSTEISVKLSTSIPKATSTLVSTSTASPTLYLDDAQKMLYSLLKTNGDCAELCFWGIVPGVTRDKDVLEKFKYLGIEGYITVDHNRNTSHYDTRLDLFTQNPIVISIDFEDGLVANVLAEIYYLGKPEIALSDWQAFSISGILKTYGVPSEILISANPPNTSNPQYALALNYQSPSLTVVYLSNEIKGVQNNQYKICPVSNKYNQYFSVFFFAGVSHGEKLHERFLSEGKWENLSEISDLSPQIFYNLFRNANGDTCIAINSDAFVEK